MCRQKQGQKSKLLNLREGKCVAQWDETIYEGTLLLILIHLCFHDLHIDLPKGLSISKCCFGVIVLAKTPTKIFKDFCPSL